MVSKTEAIGLLYDWVRSESLRKHCFGVATCMGAYAEKFIKEGRLTYLRNWSGMGDWKEEAIINWWICGLLHDFDWEKYPYISEHPKKGCKKLKECGYNKEIIEAIMGHNPVHGVERASLMAKSLFAVDELSGLIVALARVRPGAFNGMSAKSVKKAMKKKDFAAAIKREDILLGVEEIGVDETEHFEFVIKTLSGAKYNLGFC